MLKIVMLDAIPGNPGDIGWEPIQAFGEFKVYEYSTPDEIPDRIADASVVITNKCKLTREIISGASALKLICEYATGYDNVDTVAAADNGVTVCNVPGYSGGSVAQTAFALLLELTHHCGAHSDSVHAGDWANASAFCYWKYPLVELDGKTILIAGMGNIGSSVAAIAEAMGMKVIAAQLPGRNSQGGKYPRIPLDEALPDADVLSLHCPLSDSTKGMIHANRLKSMKPSAYIINAARGPVVVEQDVADALRDGVIAGYATDVLSSEPPDASNPLIGSKNCIITPHLAWATLEARKRLLDGTAENIRAFLAEDPIHVVS